MEIYFWTLNAVCFAIIEGHLDDNWIFLILVLRLAISPK